MFLQVNVLLMLYKRQPLATPPASVSWGHAMTVKKERAQTIHLNLRATLQEAFGMKPLRLNAMRDVAF